MILFECDGRDCDSVAPAVMNRYGASGEAQIPAGWGKLQWMVKVPKPGLPEPGPILAGPMFPAEQLRKLKKIAKAHELHHEIENIARLEIEIRVVILCELCLARLQVDRYQEIGRIEVSEPRSIVTDERAPGVELTDAELMRMAADTRGPKPGDYICPKCRTLADGGTLPPGRKITCIVCESEMVPVPFGST